MSDATIGDLRDVFAKYPEVHRVLIFGSRAKGNYREGSDIDLAVEGENIDRHLLMHIQADIQDLGLLYGVDLLDLNKYKDEPIGEHVRRVGLPFYHR